jgi:hypothetical protein
MGEWLMRSVGCRFGLAGMALLAAMSCVMPVALARIPGNTDIPAFGPHIWDRQLPDDETVAQQTPAEAPSAAPAQAPATTPQTESAPSAAPAPAAPAASPPASAPPEAAPGAAPETEPAPDAAPADPAAEDILPDLSPESQQQEDFSVGEIPTVETIELTPDTARKAMDAYVVIRDKYKDAPLENYENLQDFVEQDAQGKDFEADIKSFGFATANDWNIAVTTVGFAYSNLIDDQTADLRAQIEEVKNDTEMAQDMRDRMVQALSAMIPSDNNRKVVDEMMKDPVYAEKLKALETEEE